MPWDQQQYERLRLELIDRNEARVDNVYLDVLGIPTVGFGVALTARQRDRSMRVDQEHVDALADVMNLDPERRSQLGQLLTDYIRVQNRHTDERFRNLGEFQRSQFGQEALGVLGPMTNTRHTGPGGTFYSWDVLSDPQSPMRLSLTHEQSLELFQRIAPDYENRLDGILRRADCPAEALSEEQRAALYSMAYHGATGKANRVAEPIGEYWRGEITEGQLQSELLSAVNDPNFPVRSANELELLQNIERRLEQQDQDNPGVGERRRMIEGDRAPDNAIPLAPPLAPGDQTLLNDPGHPDNSLYQQVLTQTLRLPRNGRVSDEVDQTDRQLSAALAVKCKEAGMGCVNHVVLSRDGSRAFAVDTPDIAAEWRRRADVDVAEAIRQPLDASTQQMAQVNLQLSRQAELERQQQRDRGPDDPSRGGPVMA